MTRARLPRAIPRSACSSARSRRTRSSGTSALEQTGIKTEWVLALDADFVLTEDVDPRDRRAVAAAERRRVSRLIHLLHRRQAVTKRRVSAGHRAVSADPCELSAGWPHAARPRRRDQWPNCRHASCMTIANRSRTGLRRRSRYMRLEAEKLSTAPSSSLGTVDRVRRWIVVAPPAMFLHCLFVRGGILDGWAGLYYALQRAAAEIDPVVEPGRAVRDRTAACRPPLVTLSWRGGRRARGGPADGAAARG